jgi:nucleotide-binding universal stress UspA family protein
MATRSDETGQTRQFVEIKEVVVAVDGSDGAAEAVNWAADDAARRQVPLRIVHVYEPWPYDLTRNTTERPDGVTQGAGRILGAAQTLAAQRRPGLTVTIELLEGHPGGVLRDLTGPGVEMVVGRRGLGGFAGALLGSVSTHVAGQGHGPVVVVRPGGGDTKGRVVVGIDDSDECEPAVAYAFEQARLRHGTLRAVSAWQLPTYAYTVGIPYNEDELIKARREAIDRRLDAWRARFPDVEVVLETPYAHPVTALTQASETADLIVVGSRGRGALEAVVLGSVGRAVLHHTRCPIAVVR